MSKTGDWCFKGKDRIDLFDSYFSILRVRTRIRVVDEIKIQIRLTGNPFSTVGKVCLSNIVYQTLAWTKAGQGVDNERNGHL